jgi:hypothetical protein
MRFWKLIVFIILISSCADERDIKLRALRKNNYNLPELKRFFGLNHSWKMSSWFIKQDTTDEWLYPNLSNQCISKRNQGYKLEALQLYFTVEQLNKEELDEVHFIQGQSTRFNSLREHFLKRLDNTSDHSTLRSSKPRLIKNMHGYHIEFIHLSLEGDEFLYNNGNGFLAIMQRGKEYLVIQWYGSSTANAYLADDFISTLKSFD